MLLGFLVTLFIAILIFGLIWYGIKLLPLEEPWKQALRAVLIVIAVVYLLGCLTGYAPIPIYRGI